MTENIGVFRTFGFQYRKKPLDLICADNIFILN
jgi:hypothetical protein